MTLQTAPTVKMLPIEQLKQANYNPPNRVVDKNVKNLAKSMTEIGLVYPVVVDDKNVLIDGHRRLAAAKMNGWTELPVIVKTDRQADVVYGQVNAQSRRMTSREALIVWFMNPQAITPHHSRKLASMQEVIGRDMVKKMLDRGFGPRIYTDARAVAFYCNETSDSSVARILNWLITTKSITALRMAMKSGVKPASVMKSVRSKKQLRLTVQA